jgi:hypothetical protein
MEVTDLKGLKRLMKGDVSNKFEFVEEDGEHGQFEGMHFSYAAKGNTGKLDNPGATYNTFNPASSRGVGAEAGKYRDLSSDDSELLDQEQQDNGYKKAYEDDDYGNNMEDMMYEAPTSQTSPQVKRDMNGVIEEDDEEDASSSDDEPIEEGKTDGNAYGFIVIDKDE